MKRLTRLISRERDKIARRTPSRIGTGTVDRVEFRGNLLNFIAFYNNSSALNKIPVTAKVK